MKTFARAAVAALALAAAGVASADVTFYKNENFNGRSFTARAPVNNFMQYGFNDRASSVIVSGEPWEVCEDAGFTGRCVFLRPGDYPSLRAIGLGNSISSARELDRRDRFQEDRYAPLPPAPQISFYENDNFTGRTFSTGTDVPGFQNIGFNDRAASVVVAHGRWEACDDAGYRGRCIVLRPGSYPSLRGTGLERRISSVRLIPYGTFVEEGRYAPVPSAGMPQITFYENDNFGGRTFNTATEVRNFQDVGFNDRAESVVVTGGRWEACEDDSFRGRCLVLRPGSYPSLRGTGLERRVSSVRLLADTASVDESRYAPMPVNGPGAWRPQPQEALYQANVVSSRAVYANGQQPCWVSHDEVSADQRRDNRVGGAVIGGLLGGIIGHQIGGSNPQTGTVVGALGGAAIGAAIGNNVRIGGQDVQHCSPDQVQGTPQYWDTTYLWRGVEHHVQSTTAPGTTVTVNDAGEPRVQ